MQASITQVAPHLFLVELPVPIDGFEHFVASWVLTAPVCVVVDVGPAVTIPALVEALEQLGVTGPDYILLTHIHIDHAGGIGQFAKTFPQTPIVCHKAARSHLADPGRLWEGSLKVLGEMARKYGRIEAVHTGQILVADDLRSPEIKALNTPGHSPHHCSFVIGDILFAGETGGVCLELDDGSDYLRPATPPRFFFDTQLASLDRIIAAEAHIICYGHFGVRYKDQGLLQKHRGQLHLWRRTLSSVLSDGGIDNPGFHRYCLDKLLAADSLLHGYSSLPAAVKAREDTFLTNSIKGFLGYLQN